MSAADSSALHSRLLEGGGEMGALIRAFDWPATPVGGPEQWPSGLLVTLNMMLHSRCPMFLWWGEELIQFYNDAYRLYLGNDGKHPKALGQKGEECWPERWQDIKPRIDQVLAGGPAIWQEDLLIPLYRNGRSEEAYWTFGYSSVDDGSGKISGVLVICNETTRQVLAHKSMERVYEQARLSKEAAQLGTFDWDLERDVLEWDDRCRTLFGISHSHSISYKKDFLNGLHPDDRERVKEAISSLLSRPQSKNDYDVEYRTIGVEDGKLRWVRAKGKVYFGLDNTPLRFIGSVLDITEQKMDELRKNDFISMVSHELKTPLTSLKAYIQILLEYGEQHHDAFIYDALRKSDNQVRKMSTLINSFLNISRLESGKIHLDKESFDLNNLAQDMIDEMQLILGGHHIIFEPCNPVTLFADRDKIGSVISNLLSNAGKYSAPGSTIKVSCHCAADQVQLSVADEGIGIASPDMEKLFDRYYRVESKRTRQISGFGIGLYLSNEIIQRHNGRIWVESRLNAGSVFHFTLPLL